MGNERMSINRLYNDDMYQSVESIISFEAKGDKTMYEQRILRSRSTVLLYGMNVWCSIIVL